MNRSRARCRRCPENQAAIAADKASAQLKEVKPEPKLLTSKGEAERLWKHVLFGTGTCVGMLCGYTDLEMPGNPLQQLYALRDQLNAIIEVHERRQKQK